MWGPILRDCFPGLHGQVQKDFSEDVGFHREIGQIHLTASNSLLPTLVNEGMPRFLGRCRTMLVRKLAVIRSLVHPQPLTPHCQKLATSGASSNQSDAFSLRDRLLLGGDGGPSENLAGAWRDKRQKRANIQLPCFGSNIRLLKGLQSTYLTLMLSLPSPFTCDDIMKLP